VFEAFIEVLKLVFGEGLDAWPKITKLGRDSKKWLFWSLMALYESVERLDRNLKELLDYSETFIRWIRTGEVHTLSAYAGSVRGIYCQSSEIVDGLLKAWQRQRGGIESYVKLRDPEAWEGFRRLLQLKRGYSSILRTARAAEPRTKREVFDDDSIDLKYFDSFAFVTPPDEDEGNARYVLKTCRVDNLTELEEYSLHLQRIRVVYQDLLPRLRELITKNFVVEEMF
jgi:hypothetical protein